MITPTVTIKRNDTKIRFRDTPTIDGVALTPADLASIEELNFLMRNSALNIKSVAAIDVNGDFIYDPSPEQMSTSGRFRQEWEATFIDGKILTFPSNGYNIVDIVDDLG